MARRKPPWLKHLCPTGVNPAHLTARKCETCHEWVAVDTGGPIEEKYDPGILDGDDLVAAIILGIRFTRIQPFPGTGLITLRTPCGERGISPDGRYLAEHRCFRTPISLKPYKPMKPATQRQWTDGPQLSEEDINRFEIAWRRPL